MESMRGVEEKVVRGKKRNEEWGESKLNWEEVGRGEFKEVKKDVRDELPNNVWKYGGKEMKNWAWEVCRRVW